MNRILIIGSPESGKSTLANRLRTHLRLPLYHLDKINWNSKGEYLSRDQFNTQLVSILKTNYWIIDGNYNRTMALRATYADTIIWLKVPRITCLYRVSKRYFSYLNKQIPYGNPDKISLSFLLFVWRFKKNNVPNIQKIIDDFAPEKQVIKLTCEEDITTFLNSIK